jgi:hypothetical protein
LFTLASELNLPGDVDVSVHICHGHDAVGKECDAQIGRRHFDTSQYMADAICGIVSLVLVSYDMVRPWQGRLGDRRPGVGGVAIQDLRVDDAGTVVQRVYTCGWIAPGNTISAGFCGFNPLPRRTAMGKLIAMAEAKRNLGG